MTMGSSLLIFKSYFSSRLSKLQIMLKTPVWLYLNLVLQSIHFFDMESRHEKYKAVDIEENCNTLVATLDTGHLFKCLIKRKRKK